MVDANLRFHPKAIALGIELSDPRAWTYLVELWCWVSQNMPTGVIPGTAAQMVVEHALCWREPGKLVEALIKHGWLDKTDAGLAVHDWKEHAGAHLAKAEKEAKRLRAYRKSVHSKYGSVQVRTDGVRVPNTYVRGNKKKKEKKKEKEEVAQTALDGIEPPPPPPKEPSSQERFASWFEAKRKDLLGDEWLEDKVLSVARLNTELGWVKELQQEQVADAALLYLSDPKRKKQNPPCALLWFSRDRADYLAAIARRDRGAA